MKHEKMYERTWYKRTSKERILRQLQQYPQSPLLSLFTDRVAAPGTESSGGHRISNIHLLGVSVSLKILGKITYTKTNEFITE